MLSPLCNTSAVILNSVPTRTNPVLAVYVVFVSVTVSVAVAIPVT